MITIPVLDANDSLLEVVLDEQTFFLRMSWNSEGEFWVMGLEDYARNEVLAGVLVVPDADLLAMFRHLPLPAGTIYSVLLDESRETIGRQAFVDGSAALIYLEAGEDVPL